MSNFIELKITNYEEELESFPLKQSINLQSNTPLDLDILKDNIVLIREPKEYGLLNMGDLYNFNIGYIKETFNSVPVEVESDITSISFKIKPKEILKPNSLYYLYIDKNLSNSSIDIKKVVSKGPSSLEIVSLSDFQKVRVNLKLKVMSSPTITNTMNIIKFQLFLGEEPLRYYTINAKDAKNTFEVDGLVLRVPDTAFGLNEEFEIEVKGNPLNLEKSLIQTIKTTLSSDIKPLENIKPSTTISNQDVLDYYGSLEPASEGGIDFNDKTWQTSEIQIEYLDSNTFTLTLTKLNVEDLDLDSISYRVFPCFNKYDLKQLKLYDEEEKYKLEYEILDDKTLLFTAVREEP